MKFEVVLKNLDTDRQKLITVEAESKTDAERKAGIEANKLGHVWAVNFVKSPNSRNAMDLKPVGDSARRSRLHRALDAVMDAGAYLPGWDRASLNQKVAWLRQCGLPTNNVDEDTTFGELPDGARAKLLATPLRK
jgi:hypothetical protein